MLRCILIFSFLMALPLPALADKAADRAKSQSMRREVLARVYKEEPRARDEVANAAGYAVFSNVGVNVILFSGGYGYGIAHDNHTGRDTYMEMASAGFGLGMGVKDFRAVFIFRDGEAFKQFIDHGWDFSGQADAAAKAGHKGGELSEALDVMPDVKVYQLTETGLALQATLQGTKYWKDGDLN